MTDGDPDPGQASSIGRDQIFLMFTMIEVGRALEALDRVERLAAARYPDENPHVERREWLAVFDALRAALHFTGSVSRVFFPIWRGGKRHLESSQKAASRAERLCALTGLTRDHPIAQRAARDDMEHMDERLDAWIGGPRHPFIAVEMILHRDHQGHARERVEEACPFLYYEDERVASVFGTRISLEDWRAQLFDVRDRLSAGFSELYREAEAKGLNYVT